MGLFTKLAKDIFAAFDAMGNPRKVKNEEALTWGTEVEVILNAAVASGALVYATKADIDADLAHPANVGGWVVADTTTANNGIYVKSGASGSGSWTRKANLPQGTNGEDGAPGSSDVVGTSASSVAIGTGSKSFTVVEADRGWGVGARLRASSVSAPSNWMEGVITAYSGNALTVLVDLVGGSGTKNDWIFNLAGVQGAKGDKGDQGDTGPQGSAGGTGAAGSDGAAATIAIGTVTTVAAGTPASVTNAGTSAAAVFDFEIPKGADGDGSGDMLKATYDPQGKNADAFDRANHTGTQSADTLTDGTTNKAYTATEKTKLAGIASGADVTSATNVASAIHGATSKTTPVDADEIGLIDSEASNALKKLTWANLKATLKNYFDTLYVSLAGATMTGTLNLADQLLQRPTIEDYAETINALGTVGASPTIDLESGNVITATVAGTAPTFAFSNPSASGKCCSFTLILTNGGLETIVWPASLKWMGDAAPTLNSAGVDVLTFFTVDGGTTWYGASAGTATT
ncbi:MAG: hypothetical protein BGN87_00090 [Rhizobiales bacterium 65-79]|nr:hypothetical protein [Hyphomicrobiales bacterium]OJU02585.1 MAG: hypothetical protein BGN87_00090 [Rhizobiales bacterium 65-79]